ncbi:MAG: glycosyltransferase family 4 protein [Chryseolinea sp.]
MKVIVISFQSLTERGAAGTGRLGYAIASRLHDMQMDVSFVVSAKGNFKTEFVSGPVHKISRYYLWLINWGYRIGLISTHVKRHIEEVLFDWFCRPLVSHDVQLVVSTNCHIPNTLARCSKLGVRSVLIPGNPADTKIFDTLMNEMERWKVNTTDPYTYEPRLRNYRRAVSAAKSIVCHSSVIHETFKLKFPGSNVRACYGVIKQTGSREPKAGLPVNEGKLIVLYVGYTVLLKGLQYLLSAWAEFDNEESELWIVGSIDPSMQQIINRDFSNLARVKYFGVRHDIGEYYRQASLVVVPSLLDGGPVTPLEAMEYDVPVALTDGCGMKDIIRNGENGFIVKTGDAKEILEIIKFCSDHRHEAVRIGIAGGQTLDLQNFDRFIENLTVATLDK